jgi:hypothetical protein
VWLGRYSWASGQEGKRAGGQESKIRAGPRQAVGKSGLVWSGLVWSGMPALAPLSDER